MKQLALTIGGSQIQAPGGVPVGGLQIKGVSIISTTLDLLLFATVVFSLFSLVYGGVKWIVSEGKKEGIEAAQNQLRFAVIGLIVAFTSFIVIKFIGDFFGVDLLNIPSV